VASQAKLSRIAINQILFATDFSLESEKALHFATSMARRYGSNLTVTHVVPKDGPLVVGDTCPDSLPMSEELAQQEAEQKMSKLDRLEELHALPHDTAIASGDAGDAILQVALGKNIDLIVMGTHGYGATKKLFLGSTAEKVIRHAVCPVLTVGPHVSLLSTNWFKHILYATDFSSGSTRALAYALSLAEEDRAELTLLHVIESKPMSEGELMDWRQQHHEHLARMVPTDVDLASKAEIEIETGTPHVEILRLGQTRNADLIVMGSHAGGAASTHVPWTTLHHVLQHAHCPVLTVHGR